MILLTACLIFSTSDSDISAYQKKIHCELVYFVQVEYW